MPKTTTLLDLVKLADPDFDQNNAKQPGYEFTGGRKFTAGAGSITATPPAPVDVLLELRSVEAFGIAGGLAHQEEVTAADVAGLAATASAGTLTAHADVTLTLTGVGATGAVGTVVGDNLATSISVNLPANEATGAVGTLAAVGSALVSLTGASATGSPGTLDVAATNSIVVTITGVGATGAAGTLVPAIIAPFVANPIPDQSGIQIGVPWLYTFPDNTFGGTAPLTYTAGTLESRTNRCATYNAAPDGVLRGSKHGDAAAVWSIVDATAALLASGDSTLSTLVGTGTLSGDVYRLDNSLGTTDAFVTLAGGTANTAQHTARAWVRRVSGAATATRPKLNFDSTNDAVFTSTSFVRTHVTTPGTLSNPNRVIAIFAGAGQIVEWIGEELFQADTLHSELIVTTGAAASATVTANALPSWITFDAANRRFSGTPSTAAVHGIAVTATNSAGSATDAFNATVATASINYALYVVSNGETGNDLTGNGSVSQPYESIQKACTEAISQGKMALLQGDFFLSATVTLGSSVNGVTIHGDPSNTPIVSGGVDRSSTREQLGTSQYHWVTAPSGVIHHSLEVTPNGGTPTILEPVFWRDVGLSESDWFPDARFERQAGWQPWAKAAANLSVTGLLPSAAWTRLNAYGIPWSAGQVYAHYSLSKTSDYYSYARLVNGLSGTRQVDLGSQLLMSPYSTDAGLMGRPIGVGANGANNAGKVRFYNYAAWLSHSDCINEYAYGAACATLAFDGQVSAFVEGEKINNGGAATAVVITVTDNGSTGTLYLANVAGAFSDNDPIRSGTTARATVNGTPISKGNRLVIKSSANLSGARIVTASLADKLIDITGTGITLGGDNKGIHFRNVKMWTLGNTVAVSGRHVALTGANNTVRGNKMLGGGCGVHAIGNDNDIINNEVSYTNWNAIRGDGNRTLISHNYIHDQYFHGYCLFGSAIRIQNNPGQICQDNKIERWRCEAISWSAPSNMVVEYNAIFDCQWYADDCPVGLYSTSSATSTTRAQLRGNWIQRGHGLSGSGSETSMTWLSDPGTNSIYLDNQASYYDVYYNVVVQTGPLRAHRCLFYHSLSTAAPQPNGFHNTYNNLLIIEDQASIDMAYGVQTDGGGPFDSAHGVQGLIFEHNICINKGSNTAGYSQNNSSGPVGHLSGRFGNNATKGFNGNSGSFNDNNTDVNVSYQILTQESTTNDTLFEINPILAQGSAQILKGAEPTGITWVEYDFERIQAAGLFT